MVSCSKNEINAIREVDKDSVRVIAEYDDAGYDVQYVRDDVEAKIQQVAEEIHDELVIQGMGREFLEELFRAGDLRCSVHRFDDVTAFHFLEEQFTGLFVSVDSAADIPLATFTDTCRDVL
ncbi:MAG: hypothetical protein ACOCQM_01455 [Natronomonas sp.]